LCLSDAGGGNFERGFERALLCDSEISARPLPGDGIRLGGRICDVLIYCKGKRSAIVWQVVDDRSVVPSSPPNNPS
jgi:hypothetical protein